MFNARTIVLAAMALAPQVLAAQELTLGAGYADYPAGGSDSAVIDIGYRHAPFVHRGAFTAAWTAAASVTEEGDFFAGAGIGLRWDLARGWFVDVSVMPGLHAEGTPGNDLGSTFDFRSALAIGHRFGDGSAVSLALTHVSNAGLDRYNPGAETLIVRFHLPL